MAKTTMTVIDRIKSYVKKILASKYVQSALLAIFLCIVNYYAIYLPWLIDDANIIHHSTEVKKMMREDETKPGNLHFSNIAKDFLLIDVSNDIARYCDDNAADDTGLPVDKGSDKCAPCYAGTDIEKLTQLFEWLTRHQDQFNLIVCDLLFDKLELNNETKPLLAHLTTLQSAQKTKIIFSSIYNENTGAFNSSAFSKDLFPAYKGAVNEEQTRSTFLKYKLSYNNGSVKSLPLLMLEKIDNYQITHGKFGIDTYKQDKDDNHPIKANNLFIPEMLFSMEDFDSLKMPGSTNGAPINSTVGKMELWQALLKFDDSASYYLQEALKSSSPKTIFIGSFSHASNDIHKTLYGDIDGAIILINTYYNLKLLSNSVSWGYTLFLFISFYIISLLILSLPHELYHGKIWILKVLSEIFIEKAHDWILLLMGVLSSLWFNKACNVIVMLVVLFFLVKFRIAWKAVKK